MARKVVLSAFLIVGIVLPQLAVPAIGGPESCVAEFCFDKGALTEAWLVRRYSPGFERPFRSGSGQYFQKTHCYYVPAEDVWVEFTVDYHDKTGEANEIIEMFLSKEPLCERKYVAKTPFKRLATARGVQIGSSQDAVVRAYGQPTRVDDSTAREKRNPDYKSTHLASKFGSPVLVYLAAENELLFSAFYMKDGQVYSVLISVSE